MQKKMLCWKQAGKGSEKDPLCIATRMRCAVDFPSETDSDRCPCLTCSVKITQVGISEVVFSQRYGMDEQVKRLLVTIVVDFV